MERGRTEYRGKIRFRREIFEKKGKKCFRGGLEEGPQKEKKKSWPARLQASPELYMKKTFLWRSINSLNGYVEKENARSLI